MKKTFRPVLSGKSLPPVSQVPKKSSKHKGLIIVFTGSGKGKTSAAIGTAFRALGWDYQVAVVQFMKGKWKTGENVAAKRFHRQLEIYSSGNGFTWECRDVTRHVRTAMQAWKKADAFLRDRKHQLVILDEINYAMHYGFLDPRKVIKTLQGKPFMKHVILTGDAAPPGIIRCADLVTEMRCIKHPYQKQIQAQKGIEY